jgi:hypothetical protein
MIQANSAPGRQDFKGRLIVGDTKFDTMTTSFMKISEDRDQPCAIGEIISTPSCMHLYIYIYIYIYNLYHCHEGNCRMKEPFAEVVDSEGSQCIQRKNTL